MKSDDDFGTFRRVMFRSSEDKIFDSDNNGILRSDLAHNAYVQMLPVLRKYDCRYLETKAMIAVHAKALRCVRHYWNASAFTTCHYRRISEIYGGTYPKDLYKVFAMAWKTFKIERIEPEPEVFATLVDETPGLANFLADFYCNLAVEAEKSVQKVAKFARNALEAAEQVESRVMDTTQALEVIEYDMGRLFT